VITRSSQKPGRPCGPQMSDVGCQMSDVRDQTAPPRHDGQAGAGAALGFVRFRRRAAGGAGVSILGSPARGRGPEEVLGVGAPSKRGRQNKQARRRQPTAARGRRRPRPRPRYRGPTAYRRDLRSLTVA